MGRKAPQYPPKNAIKPPPPPAPPALTEGNTMGGNGVIYELKGTIRPIKPPPMKIDRQKSSI